MALHGDPRSPAVASLADILARPHRLLGGAGALVLPRDTTVDRSLVVLGRSAYVAARVEGDIVVVGGDLFLRPGVDVAGRAVAVGGTVARTMLGHVAGGTLSFRDDSATIVRDGPRYVVTILARPPRPPDPVLAPAGFSGLLLPRYDRVDGLSLPIGAVAQFGDHAVELEPTLTYRSRLGAWDPGIAFRVQRDTVPLVEARVARDTRTNERWIYGDLVTSLTTFLAGLDARNYFRSDLAEGRVFAPFTTPTVSVAPFVGARYERVRPITAAGNVWSVVGRRSDERIRRPNPLVDPATIGSALLGLSLGYRQTPVVARLAAELELGQSRRSGAPATVPSSRAGATGFAQLTADGRIEFPTFGSQRLIVRGHGVATAGDSVSQARYAYLGGSGTLPVVELLELGGTQLLFVESRYLIPLTRVTLPVVGSPILSLRHITGSAGIGTLPSLEQEIGVGVGLGPARIELTHDVGSGRGTKVGLSLSR